MCFQSILSIVGLFLNFIASGILSFTLIPSKKDIEDISMTTFDYNPHVRDAYLKNRKIAKYALILLAIGFIFQLIGQIFD